jgi:hypothetical protein
MTDTKPLSFFERLERVEAAIERHEQLQRLFSLASLYVRQGDSREFTAYDKDGNLLFELKLNSIGTLN